MTLKAWLEGVEKELESLKEKADEEKTTVIICHGRPGEKGIELNQKVAGNKMDMIVMETAMLMHDLHEIGMSKERAVGMIEKLWEEKI